MVKIHHFDPYNVFFVIATNIYVQPIWYIVTALFKSKYYSLFTSPLNHIFFILYICLSHITHFLEYLPKIVVYIGNIVHTDIDLTETPPNVFGLVETAGVTVVKGRLTGHQSFDHLTQTGWDL